MVPMDNRLFWEHGHWVSHCFERSSYQLRQNPKNFDHHELGCSTHLNSLNSHLRPRIITPKDNDIEFRHFICWVQELVWIDDMSSLCLSTVQYRRLTDQLLNHKKIVSLSVFQCLGQMWSTSVLCIYFLKWCGSGRPDVGGEVALANRSVGFGSGICWLGTCNWGRSEAYQIYEWNPKCLSLWKIMKYRFMRI